MTFREPGFLWLLWLLLVPLVLYLLPLPRQRVLSSALFLWEKFFEGERFGRTSERFRRVLGFCLMVAGLASLVAAAAELTLGRPGIAARRLVVVVDASASMNAEHDGRSNLDRAKAAAADLIASLDARTEVALVEAAGQLRLLAPLAAANREAVRQVEGIQRFDGPADLGRLLDEAYRLWGGDEDCQLYVFSDAPLPASRWAERARAWIAPPAGDNRAIVELSAQRRGRQIHARFTLANYGRRAHTLRGSVLVNDVPRVSFERADVGPGRTVVQTATIDEPCAARLRVRLETGPDALAVDDEACAVVPALEDWGVRLVWPNGGKHNAYVSTLFASLREEGVVGPVVEGPGGAAAVTVFVNQLPPVWPEGGVIVLHPLRSGVIEVAGLQGEPVSVTRQAVHSLLQDVDLRGLVVKDAVRAEVPRWAEPLVWAGELPLVWAGETGRTKVLFVAAPLTTAGSRLPLLASFPVLLRNACLWMLPQTSVSRPGEMADGWTSRTAGLVQSPADGRLHAFSTLSAAESDLRREPLPETAPIAKRHSLAALLVALAMVLLSVEWGLFHRRLTE
jgi:hypothetical protein